KTSAARRRRRAGPGEEEGRRRARGGGRAGVNAPPPGPRGAQGPGCGRPRPASAPRARPPPPGTTRAGTAWPARHKERGGPRPGGRRGAWGRRAGAPRPSAGRRCGGGPAARRPSRAARAPGRRGLRRALRARGFVLKAQAWGGRRRRLGVQLCPARGPRPAARPPERGSGAPEVGAGARGCLAPPALGLAEGSAPSFKLSSPSFLRPGKTQILEEVSSQNASARRGQGRGASGDWRWKNSWMPSEPGFFFPSGRGEVVSSARHFSRKGLCWFCSKPFHVEGLIPTFPKLKWLQNSHLCN
ncbi:PREDICTED: translation initiation factor IF-2-like, partial [Chinchilla lanigera]|uniref:translation initiation factor IF-2-like n=1 Tax=Chinchilla lanigera TaxID=34839 RepID=UPI000697F3D3